MNKLIEAILDSDEEYSRLEAEWYQLDEAIENES